MPVGEEIFVKEKKPKRKLTQAQLDGLAKGREKVREKRNAQKQLIEKQQEDSKTTKNNTQRNKNTRAKMNRTIAEQKELEIQKRLEKAHSEKIDKFNKIKYKYMDKCKTLTEMREMKEILDTIEEDEIYDLPSIGKKIVKMIKLKYKPNLNENEDAKREPVERGSERHGREEE